MTSRHWTICDKLKTAITSWGSTNWSGAQVEAGYQLEYFTGLISGGLEVIGVMPSAVEPFGEQARRMDTDSISVMVISLKRLDGFDSSDITPTDLKMELLRDYLRTVASVDLSGGLVAYRESVSHPAIFDHTSIKGEFWASMVLCEYTVDVPHAAEVRLT